ncbi:MAG: RsmD family RNA methyltransferase [Thermoanaerobaculia bacterium]|nr:RsmD family RNA methyltransferase [Thermoanaerobaculia bacterium]
MTTTVRIIAGQWKGRKLEVPAQSRPTSSRAREALFSMLQDSVPGARFLDLYAGSGAVGLEAASRGASRVVLVEEDAEPLRRTLHRLGVAPESVLLLEGPDRGALRALRDAGEQFDLVFSDPPYALELSGEAGETLASLLAPGGVFILQRDSGTSAPELDGLTLVRRRDYGRNVLFLYAVSATRCGPLRGRPL